MSILINKDTKVMTQGITGKTGQFHTKMCRDYANGKNCFVAGVNPKKAGEDFEGIPIFGTVKDAKAKTGATVSVIYVPPPFAAAAIDEAVEADLDLVICITEGIPVRDMIRTRAKMKGRRTLLLGPELPGRDHARRDQDRHHAGPHPPQGENRHRLAFGHAHLRGRGPGDALGLGQSSAVGIGGRPGERAQAHRHHEDVQRRPADRGRHHDRRDRRR
jgi:succinyl-CoA synthetase alpha subunit